MAERLQRAGRLLAQAWRTGEQISDLGSSRPRSRREAYEVQDAMAAEVKQDVAGWKVGAATPAIIFERGLDAPIPGPVYKQRIYPSPAVLPVSEFPFASLEAEFAFRTLIPLRPRGQPYGREELASAVIAHGAFDLTQSRYSDPPDELLEIADSGNSGGAVIGPPVRDWRRRNLVEADIDLRIDGGPLVETYTGWRRRDPLDVLGWLVNSLSRREIALSANSYVLTGSVTEPQPMVPGRTAVARFEWAGTVRVRVGGPE